MRKAPTDEHRPYHHGDLRKGLADAARRLLERDGLAALSLRAVAREAGVSPAAPYHHFKDKRDLLEAVAEEGWQMLDAAVADAVAGARAKTGPGSEAVVVEFGVAYIWFALQHPALYQAMYAAARTREALPRTMAPDSDSGYARLRATLREAGADGTPPLDLELATIATWCAAHGLAEMARFKQFDTFKTACGGELPFLRAVFGQLHLVPRPQPD